MFRQSVRSVLFRVAAVAIACSDSIPSATAQDYEYRWESSYSSGSCYLISRYSMNRWIESADSVLSDNPDFDSAFEFSNFGFVTVLIPQGNPLYGQGDFPVEVGELAFWVTLPLPDERDTDPRFSDFLPVERVLVDGNVADRLFEPPNSPFRQWLLDGPQVQELWQHLYVGGQFRIQGEKSDESSGSFVVGTPPAADFRLRADQFDACVAAMTRDLEMHQLLLEEDEEP